MRQIPELLKPPLRLQLYHKTLCRSIDSKLEAEEMNEKASVQNNSKVLPASSVVSIKLLQCSTHAGLLRHLCRKHYVDNGRRTQNLSEWLPTNSKTGTQPSSMVTNHFKAQGATQNSFNRCFLRELTSSVWKLRSLT